MEEKEPQEEQQIFPEIDANAYQAPKNIKNQFLDFYYNAIPFFTMNVAWFTLSLPILTIFPALGGLYNAVMELSQGNPADWGTVWKGFKNHWWMSLRWGAVVLLGDVILAANWWFYLNIQQSWAIFALMATFFFSVFWIAINQFSFPLLLLQKEKKVFLAIRNGYVIVIRRPLATLKVLLLTLGITVISIVIPPLWIFISMALIIHIRIKVVRDSVEKLREKDKELEDAPKESGEAKQMEDGDEREVNP